MVSEKLNRNTLKCCLSAKLSEFAWAKVLIVLPSPFFVFPSSHRHLYFVVEVLMVFSNVKARTQRSIARSKLTSFFSAEIVACDL